MEETKESTKMEKKLLDAVNASAIQKKEEKTSFKTVK